MSSNVRCSDSWTRVNASIKISFAIMKVSSLACAGYRLGHKILDRVLTCFRSFAGSSRIPPTLKNGISHRLNAALYSGDKCRMIWQALSFFAPEVIQIIQLAAKRFLAARQRVEFGRTVSLSKNFLPFLILIHTQKYFFESLYNCFRQIRAHRYQMPRHRSALGEYRKARFTRLV